MNPILWTPSPQRSNDSNIRDFMQTVSKSLNLDLKSFEAVYDWSVKEPSKFWAAVWDYCSIRSSAGFESVIDNPSKLPGATWFKGSRLNFAENLLRFRDEKLAIVFWGEDKVQSRVSYAELYAGVIKSSAALKQLGLQAGDRVAALIPNMPEAIIAMLGTVSLGGVWSSCSPDFGVSGILDRFGQIEPTVLFACDGYYFKGQQIDCRAKVLEVAKQIPTLKQIVWVPFLGLALDTTLPISKSWDNFLAESQADNIEFAQLPFDHPLFIMFSSGTTGKPKCIVHSAGGTLIEHLKELILHTNLKRSDCFFYQTTCGWMMWNWLVSGLAAGATLILYDGSPLLHEGKILWELCDQENISIFGTNAKYIASIEKENILPANLFKLSALHTILSTGSPLAPESFDFVYKHIKSDVCLSSIAGGTDVIGCLVLGSPMLPVHRGEIQTRSLGIDVKVFNENGQSVVGEKGELVCCAPFPSMPISYWADPDGSRYRSAYFEKFPGVWNHGDYVELTSRGTLIIYGRSDTVLKPGGVRIGTAEIYRQVEKLTEIAESIVVGQDWQGDVRVILFVKLQSGHALTSDLKQKICKLIRAEASPFHVPKKIIAVPDIPRTRSGKIVELTVRQVIHGWPVKNIEALSNPEALEYFKNISELNED